MPDTKPDGSIRVLFTPDQIQERVTQMGAAIGADYRDACPILVGVLKGAFIMLSDLSRALTVPHEVDFLRAASYGAGTASSGRVEIVHDLRGDIRGRHILLVEGVVDSGLTLSHLISQLKERGPASVKVATLLDKAPCRKVPIQPDYTGFVIGDEFVIGYGMDVAERFRNLPYVGVYSGA
jgi:hypoxanthine phosphoribosyltransferase